MIDWACNKDVLITFDREPVVMVRVIKPEMSPLEKRSVIKYPFCCKKQLKVMVFDNQKLKQYFFDIKEGYCFDGASIPRFFWRVIGSNTDNQFLIPALIHDVLCENHQYIDNDRELSSKIFRALLLASGVSELKANIMYSAVDLYQSVCGKWRKGEENE